MSTLGVVAEILCEVAPRALKARQIAALAGLRLPTTSKTPETVVSRDLALEIRDRGASSRFLRVDRGTFVLKEALPLAFYNVNDAYAVDWTCDRIVAGEIAKGAVDARPLRDLKPADVASYRQFHAFSGTGGWSLALRGAGWPDDENVWTGSCPCPPSASEQYLWSEWFRLISACRPAWIFGEQISSEDGLAWLDFVRSDLEGIDYDFRVLTAPVGRVPAGLAYVTSVDDLREMYQRDFVGLRQIHFVACAVERCAEISASAWIRERKRVVCQVSGAVALVTSALDALSAIAAKADDLGNAVACHEVPAVVARAEVLIAATQEASLA